MRYGSVCSGIEAATVAWHPLGWQAAWVSEIEPFPCAVLAHHYPDVPNHGDMTTLPSRILAGEVEAPDLFCGGTPCQAFSVAGQRRSLDDARGNLSLTFCEVADAIDTVRLARGDDPAIIVWENVPGIFTVKDQAFGCFLAQLAGEDEAIDVEKWPRAGVVDGRRRRVAWAVLDAQFFGLAQRRRRVFVVAVAQETVRRLGDRADPAAILSLGTCLRGDTPTRSEPRQGAARAIGGGPEGGSIAGAVTRKWAKGSGGPAGDECYNMVADAAATFQQSSMKGRGTIGYDASGVTKPVKTQTDGQMVHAGMAVRRLTPRECERLQGFPDDYTAIPWRKKPAADCPDGPRYKALGNSWAVPVVHWIGQRIADATNPQSPPTVGATA